MYKVTGGQRFGAVWDNGKCLALFQKGVAYIKDTSTAERLREMGYTVEGEAEEAPKEKDSPMEVDQSAKMGEKKVG